MGEPAGWLPAQVDPNFMDSDSESEDEPGPSPAAKLQQQPAAPAAAPTAASAPAAQPAGGAAAGAAAGEAREAGGAEVFAGLPEKLRPAEAPLGGKRKAGELEGGVGECGQHPGPCDEHCTVHGRPGPSDAKQAAAAAAGAAQRQPKRRRKKLHDLSGVGALGITGERAGAVSAAGRDEMAMGRDGVVQACAQADSGLLRPLSSCGTR